MDYVADEKMAVCLCVCVCVCGGLRVRHHRKKAPKTKRKKLGKKGTRKRKTGVGGKVGVTRRWTAPVHLREALAFLHFGRNGNEKTLGKIETGQLMCDHYGQ